MTFVSQLISQKQKYSQNEILTSTTKNKLKEKKISKSSIILKVRNRNILENIIVERLHVTRC